MIRRRYTGWGLAACALVLAADQISKWWVLNGMDLPMRGNVTVLPVLDFTLVWNRGVTFGVLNGLGGWSGPAIAAVALLIVVLLFVWLHRAGSLFMAIAIGAIAGGAIGNVMDRLRHGAVVDFIHPHIGGLWWNYVFNVGDAAIVCGVIALLLDSFFRRDAADRLPQPPVCG